VESDIESVVPNTLGGTEPESVARCCYFFDDGCGMHSRPYCILWSMFST